MPAYGARNDTGTLQPILTEKNSDKVPVGKTGFRDWRYSPTFEDTEGSVLRFWKIPATTWLYFEPTDRKLIRFCQFTALMLNFIALTRRHL